uniref:RAP domain-containing protein n=1 Tax=Panagrellus redivivus TaxID=6233 RepID=A0A7E4W0E5_PANRE
MYELIYNDLFLAEHRLQRVLIQWKFLEPRFAAKKSASLSPETRSLLILSLTQQHQHVKQALRKLYEVKACWNAYKKISHCRDFKVFHKIRAKIANSLEPRGVKLRDQIEILLLEFQNSLFAPIPFNSLSYEFQKRLIQLLPPKDVTSLKSCGNTAFKAVKKQRPNSIFVHSLFIFYFISDAKEIFQSKKKAHTVIDKIVMTQFDFIKSKMPPIYVGTNLSLHLCDEEEYSKAMDLISGDFESIEIYGREFSWKHAFNLIYKSPRVKYALYDINDIEEDEFAAFYDAIILLLKNRDIE